MNGRRRARIDGSYEAAHLLFHNIGSVLDLLSRGLRPTAGLEDEACLLLHGRRLGAVVYLEAGLFLTASSGAKVSSTSRRVSRSSVAVPRHEAREVSARSWSACR